MAFWDFLKPKKKEENNKVYAYSQSGFTPKFSRFGDNIYNSDTVQQAINAIAKEMKKLEPKHIREKDGMKQVVNGDINGILNNPNELMTTSDFIEKCIWILYINYNCYIYPTYTIETDNDGRLYKKYTSLIPLIPRIVTYYEGENGNPIWIKFELSGNRELTVRYSDVIHLRLNYALNDYEGGDKYGRPNNEALLKTLKINHVLLESVGKGIETSYSVNGILKYNTMLGGEKTEQAINEFNEHLKNSESGIIGLDMKAEFLPITRNIKQVDKETLEFLDSKVLRNYGVPIELLNGTATAEQKRAFYETTLEPLIVMFNQSFTKCLFSQQKINGGNRIRFYHNRLETMTNQQQLEQAIYLRDMGAITKNQALEIFGYPPIDDEDGNTRVMSLNYVDVKIANQYQLNNAGAKTQEETPDNSNENKPISEDNSNNDKDKDYALKMLLKAGLSEEEAKKILDEETDNEE